MARFDANGKARVGVEAVREDHPLASLLPCDNVFAIESRWYRDNPLVIRGPGAGRDVTAGAILVSYNILDFWLVGYSLGGRVAMMAACQGLAGLCGVIVEGGHPGLQNAEQRAERQLPCADIATA